MSQKKGDISKNSNWKKVRKIMFIFFKTTFALLDEVTELSLVAFVLQQLGYYLEYLIPFGQMSRKYVKTLLRLWSTSEDGSSKRDNDDDDEEVNAFICDKFGAVLGRTRASSKKRSII